VTIGLVVVFVGTILQGKIIQCFKCAKYSDHNKSCLPILMRACSSVADSLLVLGTFNAENILLRMLTLGRSNLAQGSAPLLILELAYPQHRGKLTTM
jgi:hypothetical protein